MDGGTIRRAFGATAIFSALYAFWAIHTGVIGNDFSIFWRTASSAVSAAYLHRWVNPFPYPPPTIVWLQPLRLVSPWPGYALWTLLGTGGLIALAGRMGGWRVAVATAISPAVIACAVIGQISNIVGLLVLFAASRQRGMLCSVVLGLAATIKPQIVFMAPIILLVRRDWPALAAMATAAASVLLVELCLFGVQPWRDWIGGFAFFHQVVIAVKGNAGSANPAGFAEFLGLPILPFWLVDIGLAGLLIWRRAQTDNALELAAVIALGSLFSSPYAIVYDLGAAVPFMAAQSLRERSFPSLLAVICPWTSAAVVWFVACQAMARTLVLGALPVRVAAAHDSIEVPER